jgi:hypothetical protein
MSLEIAIQDLVAAVKANTAALTGGAAASTGATETKATAKTKPAAKAEVAKGPSREDLVALLTEVKEKLGAAEAKAIIAKLGAAKMAEIGDDMIGKGFKLATEKLAAENEEPAAEDDGL